jgi:hypothetical protein
MSTISWGLAALALATMAYAALLFVLAIYLQYGLEKGPLYSGLAVLSWVVGFGVPGPTLRWVPEQYVARSPFGFTLLSAVFLVIAVEGRFSVPQGVPLVALLGFGGLGMGLGFSSLIGHMTAAVRLDAAPDLSGGRKHQLRDCLCARSGRLRHPLPCPGARSRRDDRRRCLCPGGSLAGRSCAARRCRGLPLSATREDAQHAALGIRRELHVGSVGCRIGCRGHPEPGATWGGVALSVAALACWVGCWSDPGGRAGACARTAGRRRFPDGHRGGLLLRR